MFGRTTLPETTPADAHARAEGDVLLDVREIDEWAAGHAPGATHVPLSRLTPDVVPSGTTVLCVCRSGGRSGKATEALREVGIDAVNVAGGMNTWAAAGLPVVRADGQPGTVI
ncbi:MAG: rhodanese-like domain-containing protein [Acidimicrobiia bacterium]|nr:rhodanese-like domain-containing protein [Acidimicrobiia bacterium]